MIEDRYSYYLSITEDATAAAVLVLAEATTSASLQETLTVDQAADRIGVHASTIRKRIKDGSLPVQRVGRAIRIKAVDLQTIDTEKATRKFRCLKIA
jgi:excisionase family DNA binding protein